MNTPHDNHTLPLGFRLKLVHRLLSREVRRQLDEAGPEASARRDEIVADVQNLITAAVPQDDLDAMIRSLDAIARELGWDESQPMPSRPGREHRGPRGPFGRRFGRGFGPGYGGRFPHPGFAHGEPGRFGHHERHGHHGHGCGGRAGFAQHPAVAEAYERGFSRGYAQAQQD
ncbi:hypothetical protein [Microbacterium oleivorans]|uniref:Uncharacterized protein n=1 Tax=Microbacterium oleivorans TaxID=273677 RepID=A0A177KB64_9MICO|nr:hypothetical protein [Microbacterium oleivorans]OAH50266.1 hypothetical protein AYL44_07315 [Microbacterium oleivorans]